MQLLQCSIFHNLLRTFAALQVLLDILLLTWGASEDYEIVVKTLNCGYFIWINSFVLFRSCHFYNVVSTFINVVKLDIENDNVVSTPSNVVHVKVGTHNVVSTLIWRCPTSRCHISQNTTLKQRWNVCWVDTLGQCLVPSITKKVVAYSDNCDNNHLQPFKYKIFNRAFQYILKVSETCLIWNYFCSNAKNTNKTKQSGQILIWQQIPWFKNIKLLQYSLKFAFLNLLPNSAQITKPSN